MPFFVGKIFEYRHKRCRYRGNRKRDIVSGTGKRPHVGTDISAAQTNKHTGCGMVTETGLAVALRFGCLLDFAEILFKEENTAEHPAQNADGHYQ